MIFIYVKIIKITLGKCKYLKGINAINSNDFIEKASICIKNLHY